MARPRKHSARIFVLFSSLFLHASAFAQDNFAAVKITSSPAAGNVHMLMGQGGNSAVSVGADGLLSVRFNDEEIRLIHLPAGHTDGDSAIWFTGSDVLHMGDPFFAVRVPFEELVTARIAAGAGLETLLAEGLPPEYAEWGTGFISERAWITSIYESTLTRQ